MVKINTLYNYTNHWIYPIRQNRGIDDLMVYKRNIIDLRNSVFEHKSCRISYIKKNSNQNKSYDINLKSYYIKRDTKQVLIFAYDLKEKKDKTFLLKNILNVYKLDQINTEKDIKIN